MIPSNQFTLKVVKPPANTKAFLFAQETVHIGSDYAKNDLIMNVNGISAQHAKIWREKNKFFIQNLSDYQFTIGDGISLAKDETSEIMTRSDIDVGAIKLQLFNEAEKKSLAHRMSNWLSKKNDDSWLGRTIKLVKSEKKLRIGGLAVGVFLVMLLVFNSLNNYKNSKGHTKLYSAASSEEPIALPAKGKYGYIKNNDRSHPDKAVFTFKTNASNVELYYSAGGIDTEKEVSITLNGQLIGYAPFAKGGWGKETVVRLPTELLIKGDENNLVFDSMENPPNLNQWAVKNIRIKELAVNLCDMKKARKLIDIGEEMYEQKTIDKGNLYMAYRYYSDAVSHIQDCEQDINMLRQAELKKNRLKQELEELYNSLQFAFKKAYKMNDYRKCRDILQNMVMYIPDNSDERHKQAAEKLEEYNRYFQMRKK
jgi:hypothetical protein